MESSGNTLFDPELVIGDMTEDHEGEILQFNNLIVVDPGDWTGAGAGFNVEVTDGVNTYQMRIDNDVDLYSLPAPVGTFNAIGLGSQFDGDGACSDGYQFLPRSLEDIISTGVNDHSTDLRVKVFPNPAGQLLSVQTELPVERWIVSDMNGKQLMQWEAHGVHALDISRLEPGVYVLQGIVGGERISRKFSVQ
ncbi:MAG: T9SS type A sorting domain-containing protein [Saprospirales bacterium]|nr:T9SS type A sorting domain-containing protein [Saprospirales bacterium]